jgi:hypothetical protein
VQQLLILSSYTGWGSPAANTDSVTDPGQWSLDNLGQTLIALIVNGPCFEWDANATNATDNRATIISGAPTASRDMLVSTPDRHLVFFGTETTIGDPTTQDDMFIRFSSQEILMTMLQPLRIVLVHRGWPPDHGSWALNLVEMQSMFGVILLYLQ